jgi:hypothetical protein
MSIKTVSVNMPTAYLAINKSRLKMYGKKKSIPSYYLEKGQEFQIELYNPTQEKVLATFKFNNKAVSGGLILRPGERVFLDRYLDKSKKFLFETYKVENSKSSRKAIEPNGDVEIAFFKEIVPLPKFLMGGTGQVTLDWLDSSGTGGQGITFSSANTFNSYTLEDNSITITTASAYGTPTSNTPLFSSQFKSHGVPLGEKDMSESPVRSKSLKSRKTKAPNKIETGRIDEGSNSNQDLCEGTGDFELMSFHVVRYKLLPKSQKKLSTKEYYTKYCGQCGAKCKTPFCPHCGAKQ